MFSALSAFIGRDHWKEDVAAEELLRRLGESASLVVDDRLVAELGVGRKTLYRVIYDMVRRERMYMLADRHDRMLLMTNDEFTRFMFRRAGKEIPAELAETAARPMTQAIMDASDSDLRLEEEDSDIVFEGTTDRIFGDEFDWFTIDVAPAAEERKMTGTDLPDHRQTLPERRREPWPVLEAVE